MQLAKVMDTLAGRGTGSLVLGGQKYMVIGADPGDIGAAVRGKKGGGPRRSQCTSLLAHWSSQTMPQYIVVFVAVKPAAVRGKKGGALSLHPHACSCSCTGAHRWCCTWHFHGSKRLAAVRQGQVLLVHSCGRHQHKRY